MRIPGTGGTHDEGWLRLPSAVCGVAGVVAAFLLARRAFESSVAGLVGALLLAVNPEHIEQSRNARGYTLFLLLALLACERFLALVGEAACRARGPHRVRNAAVLGLLTALMIYTHLYGATVATAQAGVIALEAARRPSRAWKRLAVDWLGAMLVAAALLAPWGWVLLNRRPGDIGYRPQWLPAPDLRLMRELLVTYAGSLALAAVLVPLAFAGGLMSARRCRPAVMLAACLVAAGIVAPLAFSAALKPVFIPRYGHVPLVLMLLLSAAAVVGMMASAGRRAVRGLGATVLGLVLLLSLAPNRGLPAAARRPVRQNAEWRALVHDLRQRVDPDDRIVLSRAFALFVFDHYRDRTAGAEVSRSSRPEPLARSRALGLDMLAPADLVAAVRGRDVWWIIETDAVNVPASAWRVPRTHWRSGRAVYPGLEVWVLEPHRLLPGGVLP